MSRSKLYIIFAAELQIKSRSADLFVYVRGDVTPRSRSNHIRNTNNSNIK